MKPIVLIIVFAMFFSSLQISNEDKAHFMEIVKKYQLTFSKPEKYKFIRISPNSIFISDSLAFSNVSFLESGDKDVLIGFYFQELDSVPENSAPVPSYVFMNYIVGMYSYRFSYDKGGKKPVIYPVEKSSGANVDYSGEYNLKMRKPFLSKYTNCKMVFFEKTNNLFVITFFLYSEDNIEDIESMVKTSMAILRFQDNS